MYKEKFILLNKYIFIKMMAYMAIILGIIVRGSVYLQNRNLFIDEANVARNIYERSFTGLALPLSYEQYAPPIFLWITKFFTSLFGYDEHAFRLYPLLTGIVALFVLYEVLKGMEAGNAAWYAIGLTAIGYIFIRYGTELKQYMSDALIVLLLLLLALKMDINKVKNSRFVIAWFIAGSIGIWASMPTVFMLAGIGIYYFVLSLQQKTYSKIWLLVVCGVLWLSEFAFYYKAILQPQIDSNYLQNFHMNYFLFALPGNKEELKHNISVCRNLLCEAGGFTTLAIGFNLLMMIVAIANGIIKRNAQLLLVIVPLLAVLVASALHQYSLIPRVALFMMPLMLILTAIGISVFLSLKRSVVSVPLLTVAILCIYNHSMFNMTWKPQQTEQITDALDFVMENGINNGNRLYLHNGAGPAFIYYTTIHPEKDKWSSIKNADKLSWDADYNGLAQWALSPSAFIFTSVYSADLANTRKTIEGHMKQVASIEKPGCYAFIYSK